MMCSAVAVRLPLLEIENVQLSFQTAAAHAQPTVACQQDASPALRCIVQQAQMMRLDTAWAPAVRWRPTQAAVAGQAATAA